MPTPRIVTTRAALRQALAGARPGLVPTMGALHQGHLELIARSAGENERTVVSIFVNPAQFGSASDLSGYPRDLDVDAALAGEAGATLIFAPGVDDIYPPGFDTWIEPGALARRWEGAARPGHFRGVATIVGILLNLVRPSRAYFGEKDYQQLQVIRRMQRDLALPGTIVACPTVRDGDGLALSSRNARLSPEARARARAVPQAISAVTSAAAAGERSVARLEAAGRAVLDAAGLTIDYFALVDPDTLEPLARMDDGARLLVAVDAAGVRLIDNGEVLASD